MSGMNETWDAMKNAVAVCMWHDGNGFLWDQAEDSGGFDRLVPMGPFDSENAAMLDASKTFAPWPVSIKREKPEHYSDAENIQKAIDAGVSSHG